MDFPRRSHATIQGHRARCALLQCSFEVAEEVLLPECLREPEALQQIAAELPQPVHALVGFDAFAHHAEAESVRVSDPVKLIGAFACILGRLEVLTVIVLFTPAYWRG